MKFKHQFIIKEISDSYIILHEDKCTVRLDFFDHLLRVAIIKDDHRLLPTFTVCPVCEDTPRAGYGLVDYPLTGRNKLSTEGFSLITPAITEKDNHLSFSIDDTDFDLDLFNLRISARQKGQLLFSDREYISYNFENELGNGSTHFITREPDEQIFGLGDKTGPVNKNKMSFKISTGDSMGFDARSSDPLYKHLPFYICRNSVGSYGIYYDTYSSGELNFGKEINNYYSPFKSFKCDEENLVYYIILGTVPEIVSRFSRLCGPVLFPPKWTFKYAGSTMSYTDAEDADHKLRDFISLCDTYDIKPGGFYLSSGYTQIGSKRYVFHWNTDKIPSPEALSEFYKDNGVEFFPNVKPCFLVNHPLYERIASKGWFLHYKDGSPAIFPFWDDYGSYLDFTNPQAFDFWTDCVKKQLVDKGYRNIWNDNNEYDILDKEVYAQGFEEPVNAYLIRPLFSYLMTSASLMAQDKTYRTVSVSRSGIGGMSRIATTWTGDNNTSFDDFRYNHKMAMTMSLSGFFNFGQDVGGFAGPCPDKELFLRWLQYGIFTPRFVLHSWNPDGSSTMPWLYPDKMDTVKKIFALRDSLISYLYNEAYRSARKNEPIIYPVFLKYPDYDVESDAFFCGDNLLVVPIFDKGADSITVDLPENNGGWYLRGQLKDKCSGRITVKCTVDDLPVFFVKAGSIMPLDTDEGVTFQRFPDSNGKARYEYLKDDGLSWLTDDNHQIIIME